MKIAYLNQVLVSTLLFLIPSNLFYVLTEHGSRVHGLRVDYLIPKLYASQLVVIALIFLWILETCQQKTWSKKKFLAEVTKNNILFGALLFISVVLVGRQFFTPAPLTALWTALGWLLVALLATILWQKRELFNSAITYVTLAITVLFQSCVAFWQFATGHSIGGYLFLGETNLSAFAGLAKTSWGGVERVLPYGTTPHPNVLGGFLALSILLLLTSKARKKVLLPLTFITIFLGTVGILLTQSVSAGLALLTGLLLRYTHLKKIPKWLKLGLLAAALLFSLLLPMTLDNPSITRRQYLTESGLKMFSAHPILGVGINTVTVFIEDYSSSKEIVRFVQPPHNVVVLLLAETGITGSFFIILLLYWQKKQSNFEVWAPLIPLLLLDHYLYTLQTGILLLTFWLLMQYNSSTAKT